MYVPLRPSLQPIRSRSRLTPALPISSSTLRWTAVFLQLWQACTRARLLPLAPFLRQTMSVRLAIRAAGTRRERRMWRLTCILSYSSVNLELTTQCLVDLSRAIKLMRDRNFTCVTRKREFGGGVFLRIIFVELKKNRDISIALQSCVSWKARIVPRCRIRIRWLMIKMITYPRDALECTERE